MADISSIVQEESYTGNAALGGGYGGAIVIEDKPVQELARFAMFANKADYDQRQKDIDTKISELADFTAIDLNGTRGKDREYLLGKWNEMQQEAADYARYKPTSQQDKVKRDLQYQKKLKELSFDVTAANKRAIAYGVRLNAINQSNDSAEEKDRRLKKLDKEFDSTEIYTPIAAEDAFSAQVPKIGEPVYSVNQISQKDANGVLSSTFKLFDPSANLRQAYAEEQGLIVKPLSANATEREKEEYQLKLNAYKKGGATLYQEAANAFNDALQDPKYRDANGNIDYNEIRSSNPLLASTVKLIDDWNAYSKNRKQQMVSGAFMDRTGTKPLANLYNPNDYFTIDKTKPLTAVQLIFLQKFKDAVPDGKQEKYDYTGEAIQAKNAETSRLNVLLDDATKRYVANLPYEKQKAGAVGADGKPLDFGNILYGVNTKPQSPINILKRDGTTIDGVSINNGVVIDKSGNIVPYTGDVKLPATYFDNSILTEFKKYSTMGTGESATEVSKLYTDNNSNYIVRMVNGEIQGIQTTDANGNPGAFASANQFQHITLTSAQQGATKYKQADTNYGAYDNKTQGSGASSGQAIELSGKVDPASLKTGQTYLVNGNSYIWDGKKLKAQ